MWNDCRDHSPPDNFAYLNLDNEDNNCVAQIHAARHGKWWVTVYLEDVGYDVNAYYAVDFYKRARKVDNLEEAVNALIVAHRLLT